jgi:hypothetical protein
MLKKDVFLLRAGALRFGVPVPFLSCVACSSGFDLLSSFKHPV